MNDPEAAIVYRLNDHGQGPELVQQVFSERGWQEFDEDKHKDFDWNLWWRTNRFRTSDYDKIFPWQRLNHYPKTTAVTKKDSLARNLKRMQCVHGRHIYNFSPVAFNVPNDYTKFVAEYTRMKEKNPNQSLYWICKPADLSRGRGIFMFKEISELQYDCSAVVQQYITNPLLISGYKFDIRIYVQIPSFNPLKLYIYEEGLVRFGTEKFDLTCLDNLYSHLTNTSINKHSPSYATDKERVGPGCKWTLTQLRHYFNQTHVDDSILWGRVVNLVILTVLVQAQQVPRIKNCFEMYGFDIIIDDNMKPWLLEVNFSPALSSDCQIDMIVKKPMLHDLLDMLAFTETDKERGGDSFKDRKRKQQKQPSVGSNGGRRSTLVDGRLGTHFGQGANSKFPSITSKPISKSSLVSPKKVTADKYSDFTPVVPGCGLPSVQQSVEDNISSGRSSADSLHSQEESIHYKGPVMSQLMSGPINRSGIVSSNSRATELKSMKKRDSKLSIYSDSAISSMSGSSENSEALAVAVDNLEKCTEQPMQQKTRRNLREPTPSISKRDDKGHPTSSSSTIIMSSSLCSRKLYKGRKTDISGELPPSIHGKNSDNSIGQGNKSVISRRRQSVHDVKQCVSTKKSSPSAPSPIVMKSPLVSRQGNANSAVTASSKPSKSTQKCAKSKAIHSTTSVGQLKSKYGSYILVFPFNDATRRCSASSTLDVKVAVLECQKWLKSHIRQQTDLKKKCDENDSENNKRVTSETNALPIWGSIVL